MKSSAEIQEIKSLVIETQGSGVGVGHLKNIDLTRPTKDLTVVWQTADGWDTVQVGWPDRSPTGEELQFVRKLFFAPDEIVVQYITESKNKTKYLYRFDGVMPLPPANTEQ